MATRLSCKSFKTNFCIRFSLCMSHLYVFHVDVSAVLLLCLWCTFLVIIRNEAFKDNCITCRKVFMTMWCLHIMFLWFQCYIIVNQLVCCCADTSIKDMFYTCNAHDTSCLHSTGICLLHKCLDHDNAIIIHVLWW